MPATPPRATSLRHLPPPAPRRPPGPGRVTDAFRAQVVDYVLDHRGTRSLEDLAAEIGVHMRTLYRWLEEALPRGPLAPVVVVDSAEAHASTREESMRPVVVLPSGARIEGLDVAAIAELVRRLGR
jgi:hypothetical protein